ncbi:MAG: protein kinase [Deltaproteobacteria bacterium]|nr:protein kinase [Deltaproteobacteria bacterium]
MHPASTLPKVFGRYLLLQCLSRGGMGEIFLAKSGQLSGFEKLCVIKKVLPHLGEDRDFIRRFIDEAQVAIQLSHANIAQVFEVGMVEGEYFLALEHVEGRDLRRMLSVLRERSARLPVDMALWIVREVASGLAYAHRKTDAQGRPLNLVHCDISPPNVIVSFEGEVKIIDFGIAKSALRLSVTNPRVGFGKLGYMAPEQLMRGALVDRRADVYAAGVLLFELLTGERLFQFPEGTDHRSMARAIALGKHPLPSHWDPALVDFDDLVATALAADPAQRTQSAEELRDGIQVALARVNPTLTSDRVGAHVHKLFADEIEEERGELLAASRTDLKAWAAELTGARTKSVSFALAGELRADPTPPSPEPETAAVRRVPDEDATWVASKVEANIEPPTGTLVVDRWSARRWVVVLGASAAVLVLAGLGLGLRHGETSSRAQSAIHPGPTEPMPRPVVTAVAEKVVDAAPAKQPEPAATPTPTPRSPTVVRVTPVKRPAPRVAPVAPGPTAEERTPPAPQSPSGEEVQAKYKAVAREYSQFKQAYGSRLESDWNDILSFTTYESGPDKHLRLQQKLEQFRQRMAEVKREN